MKIVHYIPLLALITLVGAGLLQAQTNATESANATTNLNTNAVSQILALVATNPPAAKPQPQQLVIQSVGPAVFEQVGHGLRMIYRDHVRADSPSLKLRCDWLRADLSQAGRPTNIVAETNVVIDATDVKGKPIHATGDRAVYVYDVLDGATNETLTLTNNAGNATAEYKGITMKGDPIIVDLIRQTITTPNSGETIIRGNFTGKLPGTNSPALETNAPAAETNRPSMTTHQTNALK